MYSLSNTLGWNAVTFCACTVVRLFSVVFCTVRGVHEFDCRLFIIEITLRNVLIEAHVFGRIRVFSPDHRRELCRESTHALQLNCFSLSKGLYMILQLFYWVGKLFKWKAGVLSSLWTAGTQEPLVQKGKGKGVRQRLLVFWYGMQVDARGLSDSRSDESQEMSKEFQSEFRHQAGQTA